MCVCVYVHQCGTSQVASDRWHGDLRPRLHVAALRLKKRPVLVWHAGRTWQMRRAMPLLCERFHMFSCLRNQVACHKRRATLEWKRPMWLYTRAMCLYVCLCLSVCVCEPVCLSVCIYVCVIVYIYPYVTIMYTIHIRMCGLKCTYLSLHIKVYIFLYMLWMCASGPVSSIYPDSSGGAVSLRGICFGSGLDLSAFTV